MDPDILLEKKLKAKLYTTVGLVLLAIGPGCVSLESYRQLENELATSKEQVREYQEVLAAYHARKRKLQKATQAQNRKIRDLEYQLADIDNKKKAYKGELERVNRKTELLHQTLSSKDTELKRLAEETQHQRQTLSNYKAKLRKLIDSGDLFVSIEEGRLVVELPSDILFDSGSAQISTRGRLTLVELGEILASMVDRRFQVEGHTDNDPVRRGRFKSNWHLGHARAMAVLNILIEAGVHETRLSVASFGEYRSKAPNDSPVNKAQNRRIEIVIIPNLHILSEEQGEEGVF